jgi:aspartate racemase
MGPFASAHFLKLLLKKISEQNINMPEIILDSVSIKDFISDQTQIKPALIILKDRVKKLNDQNVDLIIMTCNTAHILHPQLSIGSRALFPSLIDLVTDEVKKNNLNRVGLLATPTTIKTNLYTDKFLPDKKLQNLVEKIIKKAIISEIKIGDTNKLIKETKFFIKSNKLDGLILGCTELPLFFQNPRLFKIPILNSLDILANSVIDFLKC